MGTTTKPRAAAKTAPGIRAAVEHLDPLEVLNHPEAVWAVLGEKSELGRTVIHARSFAKQIDANPSRAHTMVVGQQKLIESVTTPAGTVLVRTHRQSC